MLNGSTPSGSGKFRSATVGGTLPPGSPVFPRNVTYAYGAADPEAPSALMNAAGGTPLRSYSYDPAGNQIEVHAGAIANPSRPTDKFIYDGDDQLRRATKYAAGTTTVTGSEEYFYDHSGQRVGVVTRNAAGTVTKIRAFLGDTEVELSAAGAATQAFAYLSLGTPVAKVVSPSGGWTSTATTWANSPSSLELQYHGLSSNTLLSVRPDGAVQAGFVYAPYGDVVQTTGATSTTIAGQRRRFNDKFRDDLTSLTYYGVRYYDGLALTWTQADPMYRFVPDAAWTEPRRAGLYGFVLGNPVRYFDPDGRDIIFEGTTNQIAPIITAYHNLAGKNSIVRHVPVKGAKNMHRIIITSDGSDAKRNRTSAALIKMSGDRAKTVLVRNSDMKDAKTADEKNHAKRAEQAGDAIGNGGGSFKPTAEPVPMTANKRDLLIVGAITVNFSKMASVTALDQTTQIDQTPETVLGHETLGHGDKGCRDEKCARDEENKIRKDLTLPAREPDPRFN